MPAGRPTKYSEATLAMTDNYIDNYEEFGDVFPSNAGLADHLGISWETVQAWRNDEDKTEFSDMLARLQTRQEKILWNKGMLNVFNANLSKLALTKHGYSDRQDTEVSGPGGGPIKNEWSVEFIDPKLDNASDPRIVPPIHLDDQMHFIFKESMLIQFFLEGNYKPLTEWIIRGHHVSGKQKL